MASCWSQGLWLAEDAEDEFSADCGGPSAAGRNSDRAGEGKTGMLSGNEQSNPLIEQFTQTG